MKRREFLAGIGSILSAPSMQQLTGSQRPNDCNTPRIGILSGHVATTENGGGALSCTGKREFLYNDRLVELFQGMGDNEVKYMPFPATLSVPLKSRPEIAKTIGSGFCLEIHHDSVQPEDIERVRKLSDAEVREYGGFSFHTGEKFSKETRRLSELMAELFMGDGAMYPNTYHHRREGIELIAPGIYLRRGKKGLYILEEAKVPTVVVECGSIVIPQEETLVSQGKFRNYVTACINRALLRYFGR